MYQLNAYSCGSGSSDLLFTGDNLDYKDFQIARIPWNLKVIKLSGVVGIGIDNEERAWFWSEGLKIMLKPNVTKIACGWTHVLFISEEKAYSYGQGAFGQLGLGNVKRCANPENLQINGCINVGCGFRTSFVITREGTFCFGENRGYQLGLPIKSNIKEPTLNPLIEIPGIIEGGNKHTASLNKGRLFVWGQNNYGQLGILAMESQVPTQVNFHKEISQIGCGWYHTAFSTVDKELYITGRGDLGQQGNGETSNSNEFKLIMSDVDGFSCGSEHNLAISNGRVFSWGWNEHGNLGIGTQENQVVPLQVSIENPIRVICGGAISYIISS
ncbi:unnamed protein product [Blepharisma stoltei]|uniref:Uncharacterized protein n=1 Tax=Blepharisma stoltei TaxID=1481888 RepID=A0AAU9IJS0_9CILI|nr:unnamed protein product [Blepharisma stoltei]